MLDEVALNSVSLPVNRRWEFLVDAEKITLALHFRYEGPCHPWGTRCRGCWVLECFRLL